MTILCEGPSALVDRVAVGGLVYVPGMRCVAAGIGALAGLTNWPPWYLVLALTVLAWGAWPDRPRVPLTLRPGSG